MQILLGQVPVWAFYILDISVLLVAAYAYKTNLAGTQKILSRLLWAVIGLKLAKPIFFTWSQWHVWRALRPEFLSLPLAADLKLLGWLKAFSFLKSTSGGYFIFYSFGRFWLAALLALATAAMWWALLKIIASRRPEAIYPGEASLAWVTGAIAGWPGIVLYVPLTLLLTLIGSAYHDFKKIDSRLPIGWPMIIASLIVLVAGSLLLDWFGLGVLRV